MINSNYIKMLIDSHVQSYEQKLRIYKNAVQRMAWELQTGHSDYKDWSIAEIINYFIPKEESK